MQVGDGFASALMIATIYRKRLEYSKNCVVHLLKWRIVGTVERESIMQTITINALAFGVTRPAIQELARAEILKQMADTVSDVIFSDESDIPQNMARRVEDICKMFYANSAVSGSILHEPTAWIRDGQYDGWTINDSRIYMGIYSGNNVSEGMTIEEIADSVKSAKIGDVATRTKNGKIIDKYAKVSDKYWKYEI